MPFDDLDLEFEDEEESRKKKKEAVDVDVDLEFQAPDLPKPRPMPQKPVPPPESPQTPPPRSAPPQAEVRKIEEARIAQVKKAAPAQSSTTRAPVSGSSALKENVDFDIESQQIVELQEQVRKIELESQVKVAVAEFKMEFLTEMLSDVKLLEHQIGQLLTRINAKHPDMKNEIIMIKKVLAEFSSKKRK